MVVPKPARRCMVWTSLCVALITLGLPGHVRAAIQTYDLVVHAFCEPPGQVPLDEDPYCQHPSEQALRENIIAKVRVLNRAFCANFISFRHVVTQIVYDADLADFDGVGTKSTMSQMATNDPERVHVFVLHRGPAGRYDPPLELVVSPTLDGGGWAHEMGHYFSLQHTFTWQDQAEIGGATINRDNDGLACTNDDPGVEEKPPDEPPDFDGSGTMKVGHEFCDYMVKTSPPVDGDSPKADYCSWQCYIRPDAGSADIANGIVSASGWLAAPPSAWNAMAYFPGPCKGPFILGGQLYPAFCSDQRGQVLGYLGSDPWRQQLQEVCLAGGDPDCDGLCTIQEDNCPGVSNPDQMDTDGDGVGDECDPCPGHASVGIGAPDLDRDGLADACDDDIDGDGCPQVCAPGDFACPGNDLRPYNASMIVGVIEHPSCPGGNELLEEPESADSDGDGIRNCADDNDDFDAFPDAIDNCPIFTDSSNNPFMCHQIGLPCGAENNWLLDCRFTGCYELFLKLVSLINPDPSYPVIFEDIALVGGTFYLPPMQAMSLSQTGALFEPGEGGALALVLVDPVTGSELSTVAEWDSGSLQAGDVRHGAFLAVTPTTAGGAAALAADELGPGTGIDLGATWTVGAPPGTAFADADGDFVPDSFDNCNRAANAAQLDANGDGFGDACDPDFDDDGVVDSDDDAHLLDCLGVDILSPQDIYYDATELPPGYDVQAEILRQSCLDADLNGDGIVGDGDYALLTSMIGQPPGPSGVVASSGLAVLIPLLSGAWPAAFGLLLAVAGVLLLRGRRRAIVG
ncbi:MAG: hypothetical protein JRE70_12645 [Deltaproteobacteria bacterium]|nr:hypothetical protein [Deltaproteobacteria bacterium]